MSTLLTKKRVKTKIDKTTGDKVLDAVIALVLITMSIVSIYPLYYTVIASMSNPVLVGEGKVWLVPLDITTAAYEKLYEQKNIWIGYRNSLIYTFGFTFTNLLVTLPCAYAMARKTLPGQKVFFMYFLICMYFSGGTIPSYLIANSLGLINTMWIMVIPQGVGVFYLIICRNYFAGNIPDSLFEAATIDGSSVTQFFIRFVVPLSKPITATMALYFSVGHWNSYLTPMIYIQDTKKQSLQVLIRSVTAALDNTAMENMDPSEISKIQAERQLLKYAVVVVSALPLMLLYPFVQRFLINGVMVGAVKE